MDSTRPILDLDALAMLAKCSTEITNLQNRLRDKESENEILRKRAKELEEQLRDARAKLDQVQKAQANNPIEKTSKRSRLPSVEFGPQTKPKETEIIEILDDVEMADAPQYHQVPSVSKIPKHEKSLQRMEQALDNTINLSTPSNPAHQSRSSPPTKKRKIEIVEPNIQCETAVNVDRAALGPAQEKAVVVPQEASPSANNSSGPSAFSSSSGNPEKTSPAPGPSNSLCFQEAGISLRVSIPLNIPARNAEPSSSARQVPMVKTKSKPQNQSVKEEKLETLLAETPPNVQPASTAAPSTPIPSSSTSSETGIQMKKLPAEAKKRKIPKVEENLTLPDSDVKKFLDSSKPIIISPPPLELEVSRKFLRVEYGGSDMQFLQYFKTNPSGNRERRAVFPRLDLNPLIASRPGEPGLIFASRHEILENPPWTLFVKLRNETPALWMYLGEYKCTLSGKMTAEQFRAQSGHVQAKWGQQLLDTKEFTVYVAMRARIALRKAGRIPLDDKETEEALVQDEISAVRSKRMTLPVSVEDIVEAFVKGDEGIDIIRMECIEYDHVFANDMNMRMATYNPAAGKQKREKSSESGSKPPTMRRRTAQDFADRWCSTSAPPSSRPSASSEGLRRSTRPHAKKFQIEATDSDNEDDCQSLYEELED